MALTRAATFVLLLAAGVVALLYALRLAAVAAGWTISPFAHLGVPPDHVSRAWLLAGVVIALTVLVWLVLRHGEESLWLPREDGGVLVPAAAVAGLLEETARRHPEVVRAEAALRVRDGAVGGTLRVWGRPLADAARLASDLEPAVRDRLAEIVGVASARLVVRPRILTVPQLKRYLP